MISWFFPPRRAVEATPQQLVAAGAIGGAWDPIDDDGPGWRPAGSSGRPVPEWTLERARQFSIAGYRINPMAKAIIDTYTSFCVGDSGVTHSVSNPKVAAVVKQFWEDPRNRLGSIQELLFRSELLNGETLLELMVGSFTGVTRFKPYDPSVVFDVVNTDHNALWPDKVLFRDHHQNDRGLKVAQIDDATELRVGQAAWHTPFRALSTDTRSLPFLTSVMDWLDAYDGVLSNLIDRTALARYMVWDVTVTGGQPEVDAFIKQRGGNRVPQSGSIEVHNESVKWEPKYVDTGAYQDVNAAKSILTLAAAGSGLAKTWLAEPEDSNRATSLTMAEPVRRRVKGVQAVWLDEMREIVRFAVDQAVTYRRLPRMVDSVDSKTGEIVQVPAALTVEVTGPEIAAADAQLHASVLLNLATGLEKMVDKKILTPEAAQVAGRKAWEDFMGIPWRSELAKSDVDPDDIATHIDDQPAKTKPKSLLEAV